MACPCLAWTSLCRMLQLLGREHSTNKEINQLIQTGPEQLWLILKWYWWFFIFLSWWKDLDNKKCWAIFTWHDSFDMYHCVLANNIHAFIIKLFLGWKLIFKQPDNIYWHCAQKASLDLSQKRSQKGEHWQCLRENNTSTH